MDIARVASMFLVAAAFSLGPARAEADDWMTPRPVVTLSSNGQYRVTVVPRLPPVLPSTTSRATPGGESAPLPHARVEQRGHGGAWRLVWQQPLVNEVAPVSMLLADDASFLVTFDNWHAAGYGDDVVAIYDRHGALVRKFSLEQLLPADRLREIPTSVSSRWWGGKHQLVDGDRAVELKVINKRTDSNAKPAYSSIRIRLADGEVLGPRQ